MLTPRAVRCIPFTPVFSTAMTSSELARKIDHTILKPEATAPEVHRVVAEAMQHGFASVCIAPIWVGRVAAMLRGSGILTCTVVSFPHGTNKPTVKAIEATSCIKEGADEIDIVAHLPYLASLNVDSGRAELIEIVRAARSTRRDVIIKVIIESAYLLSSGSDKGEAAIEVASRAVRESGCDFIKTSTGFHPSGGASLEAVRLMKKYGDGLFVKASGGIRDLTAAMAMIEAGADRLGLSGSVGVMEEIKKLPA